MRYVARNAAIVVLIVTLALGLGATGVFAQGFGSCKNGVCPFKNFLGLFGLGSGRPGPGVGGFTLPGVGLPGPGAGGYAVPGFGVPNPGAGRFVGPGFGLPGIGPGGFVRPGW